MSKTQHLAAQRLLPVLVEAARTHKLLTYQTAAKAIGRDPKKNARMVAQVCDLLDAAAAFAGVPLLALIVVREASGDINRSAWVRDTPSGVREKIISRSLQHQFTADDFAAIKRALEDLDGIGNRAAWKRFSSTSSREQRYRSLTEPDPLLEFDAINDIGTDEPASTIVSSVRYARDPKIRSAVIHRSGGKCELCGKLGFYRTDGSRYLESHHIISLADEGADRMTNVIALCPDDHREAHFGRRQIELEKEMIRIVTRLENRNFPQS